ncbi:MAG: hypothetical protein NDI94_01410 [Candidatus Woesearchaeota archaeon]|nr:hypothetical protein [Candidatus Woesearchaeota archaeon]
MIVAGKVEQEIIGVFSRDITQLLSINRISKILNKAYPHINGIVNSLIKEDVLQKKQIGKSCMCSINLESSKAVALLSLVGSQKKEDVKKNIESELILLQKKFRIYTIFSREKSIYFVLDHIYDSEAIKKQAKSLKRFNLVFYSVQDFQSSILKTPSLVVDNVILYSSEKYYELINDIRSELMGRVMFQ